MSTARDPNLSDSFVVLKNEPQDQLTRDFEMIQGAILHPGKGSISGELLKKILTLFYVGGVYHLQETWQPSMTQLASVLCHGSRVLIECPAELDLMHWLFQGSEEKKVSRIAATHGIVFNQTPKIIFDIKKHLREIKVKLPSEAVNVVKNVTSNAAQSLSALCEGTMFSSISDIAKATAEYVAPENKHYGVNLALNGEGNVNSFSNCTVDNNGEHGHLYLCHYVNKENNVQGLLVGIEQSAPGKADQNGHAHSVFATSQDKSATHGDNFGKKGEMKDVGPFEYYDGQFVALTKEQFNQAASLVSEIDLDTLLRSTGNPTPKPNNELNEEKEEKEEKYEEEILTPRSLQTNDEHNDTQIKLLMQELVEKVVIVYEITSQNEQKQQEQEQQEQQEQKHQEQRQEEQKEVLPKMQSDQDVFDDFMKFQYPYGKSVYFDNIKNTIRDLWEDETNRKALVDVMKICKPAVIDPTTNLSSLCTCANTIQNGAPSLGWKLLGGFLIGLSIILGAVAGIVAAASAGATMTGIFAPLGLLGAGAAVGMGLGSFSLFTTGCGFFHHGKQKGLNQAVHQLADELEEKKTRVI